MKDYKTSTVKQMLSGRAIDLSHPQSEDIELSDLAYGLGRIERWTGQTPWPWTVAHHSLLTADLACAHGEGIELEALMHDAHEAIVGDLSSPLKNAMAAVYGYGAEFDAFRIVEAGVLAALRRRFNLPPVQARETKDTDDVANRMEYERFWHGRDYVQMRAYENLEGPAVGDLWYSRAFDMLQRKGVTL